MIEDMLRIFKNKKKIVLLLFLIAVVLLLINVIAAGVFPNESDSKKNLSSEEISQKFFDAIKRFGFVDEWIVKKTAKLKSFNPTFTSYSIQVPSDLPIPVLISEVFAEFSGTAVDIVSKELKKGGLSELEFLINEKKVLKANFDYENTIHRKAVFIGFIIYDEEQMDSERFKILNSSAEKFSFLFLPSNELNHIIKSCKKEYSLILNDEIVDVDFKLEEDYSNDRLSRSVKSIIQSFGSAAFYLIDDDASLFNSSKGKFIVDWFRKGKLKILFKNKIENISSVFGVSSEIKKILNSMLDGEARLILLGSSDYLSISEEIAKYKKIGYKFINPSEVLQLLQ